MSGGGVGKNIQALRLAKGWTLEKLEEESGVAIGTLHALEARDSSRSQFFPAIAKALGVTVEQMCGEQQAPREDGGPAFPTRKVVNLGGGASRDELTGGMALRDYFAAKAMQAEMITTFSDATPEAADEFVRAASEAGRSIADHLAFNAYLIADAMLKARLANG